jgi:anti-sigma factor RsiW
MRVARSFSHAAQSRHRPRQATLRRGARSIRKARRTASPAETEKDHRIYSLRSFAWTALAASLVLAASPMGWRQTRPANSLGRIARSTLGHIIERRFTRSPLDRPSHVKPWFQGKLPFSFNLPDVLPADTTLKGGDLTYLDGQPAALLLFTIHKHEVSVFVTQRSGSPVTTTPSTLRSGFAIHYATTHDVRIVAVSDVNPADLDPLVSALEEDQSAC